MWIEIVRPEYLYPGDCGSPPAREVWIEILGSKKFVNALTSPPAREVWIEIVWNAIRASLSGVTSRTGGVD